MSLRAEDVHVPVRLVTAPRAGVFRPARMAAHGRAVVVGEVLGVVVTTGEEHPIRSPFAGALMGLLALPGERVQRRQPVAWLTTG